MQQIAELERRITAALERIGRGVETLGAQGALAAMPVLAGDEDFARLTEALDEERMANAQMAERLRAIKDKDISEKAGLIAARDALQLQLDGQSDELARLRHSLDLAVGELADLRDMAERGVVEPEHINKAMLAELQALRSARASEASEIADIIAALSPLVAEVRPHA